MMVRIMLEYSKDRIRAFLSEANHVAESEFPYEHSRLALRIIEGRLAKHLEYLEYLEDSSPADMVRDACTAALTAISHYLPLVGFVLRSTNVRNAFEVYSPLLRLSREMLGDNTKLILASEWDFSPFIYVDFPALEDFVLIGIPATESGNPLLIPLAGHELGHTLWRRQCQRAYFHDAVWKNVFAHAEKDWAKIGKYFVGVEQEKLTEELFAQQVLTPAFEWAMRQTEETFCDFVGCRVFGQSYLHAFAYLLSPSFESERSPTYPNNQRRILNLKHAASKLGVDWPEDFEKLFSDLNPIKGLDDFTQWQISVSDATSESLFDQIVEVVAKNPVDLGVGLKEQGSKEPREKICSYFLDWVVPPRRPNSLVSILNAAWDAYQNKDLWIKRKEIKDKKRTLKELVLKSIEVLEYNSRVEKSL